MRCIVSGLGNTVGVLIAISIPIFTSQLEKSREAVDTPNLRSAYAEVTAAARGDNGNTGYYKAVLMKQKMQDLLR